jgi:hypothetical protein
MPAANAPRPNVCVNLIALSGTHAGRKCRISALKDCWLFVLFSDTALKPKPGYPIPPSRAIEPGRRRRFFFEQKAGAVLRPLFFLSRR